MTTLPPPPAPAPAPALAPQSIVFEGVDWDYYDRTCAALLDTHVRITYDRGRMELMPPPISFEHELPKRIISRLIEIYSLEMDIPVTTAGSITARRRDLDRGVEPDECYYVQTPVPPRSPRIVDLPPNAVPDLAIEVDITSGSIPRQPIYAALGVPEIWRYDRGQGVTVLIRQPDATYALAPRSRAFPALPMDVFNRHVEMGLAASQHAAVRAFRDYLRQSPPPAP